MEKFEAILNSLQEKPARSRLDPYCDLIKELLRRGWTYREIARILLGKCGIRVSISTIHHFVHTRSRSKRKPLKSHSQNPERKAAISTARNEEKEATGNGRQTVESENVYRRIAALKQRPASPKIPSTLFNYDPDKPLHLPSKTEKNRHDE
jgi:IS30 family transposase